ncbi:Trp biosynthesis-associated membrane protein [Ornithinimicrobium sp. Y1694]|uniref:Trp biosynthesis-associated membrane protein n=1 Tax=Ornithinimicrobium sp. Y1694 TaxID=3418590 RepID=UPI003CF5AFD1
MNQAAPGQRARTSSVVLVLLGAGLFLLAATQPWLSTVVEAAPGAPRVRERHTGSSVLPWGGAAALLATVATLAGLGLPRGRAFTAGLTAIASVATLSSVLLATSGAVELDSMAGVVSSSRLGWVWVALVGAVVQLLGAMGLLRIVGSRPAPQAGSDLAGASAQPPANLPEAELRRRQAADQWSRLSAGEDPTDGPAAHR